MIAGRPPFDGVNAVDTIGAILHSDPAPLPLSLALPPELERILAQALRKDREERYQTSNELFTDLKKLRHELEFQADLERLSNSGAHTARSNSGQKLAQRS